jgi:hypothetical protein
MDAKLQEVIEKFADMRRSDGGSYIFQGSGLDTPEGAYCMCDATSDAFIKFARENGYTGRLERYDFDVYTLRNPDTSLYRSGQHDAAKWHCASWHAIVETEEFLIDFTAKQYHSQACYPHIISRKIAGIAVFGEKPIDLDDLHAEQIGAAAAAGGN